jgi:hypothetical protein
MDSGNQTGEVDKDVKKQAGEIPANPDFVVVSAKDPNCVFGAKAAIDLGKKVLLDEFGLNSSELAILDAYAKK